MHLTIHPSTSHHTTCTAQVLQCISQLELAQLIGAGVKTRYLTFASSTPQKAPLSRAAIDAVLSGTGMGPPLPSYTYISPSTPLITFHPPLLYSHLTLHTSPHMSPSTPPLTSHPPHFSHLTLHTSPHISPSIPPLTSHPPHTSPHISPPHTFPHISPPLTSHPPHFPSHLTLHTLPLKSHLHTSPHISPSTHFSISHPPHTFPYISPPHISPSHLPSHLTLTSHPPHTSPHLHTSSHLTSTPPLTSHLHTSPHISPSTHFPSHLTSTPPLTSHPPPPPHTSLVRCSPLQDFLFHFLIFNSEQIIRKWQLSRNRLGKPVHRVLWLQSTGFSQVPQDSTEMRLVSA